MVRLCIEINTSKYQFILLLLCINKHSNYLGLSKQIIIVIQYNINYMPYHK